MNGKVQHTRPSFFTTFISLILDYSWGRKDSPAYRIPIGLMGPGQRCEFYNGDMEQIEYFFGSGK